MPDPVKPPPGTPEKRPRDANSRLYHYFLWMRLPAPRSRPVPARPAAVASLLLLGGCLSVEEPAQRPIPIRPKGTPDRELMGYKGKVGSVETTVYENGRDSTGTFTQIVAREMAAFESDGRLLEWTRSREPDSLTYGVRHMYQFDELERSFLTRGYSPALRVTYARDEDRRIVGETATSGSDTEYTCARSYDSRGNRLSRVCVNPGGGSMGREDCTYDSQGRLAGRVRKRGEADIFAPGERYDWYEGLIGMDQPGVASRETFEYGISGDYLLRREWTIKDTVLGIHHLTFRKGLLVHSLVFDGKGDTVGTLTYGYDEKGNVASLDVDFDPYMGSWIWRDEFRYGYDLQGNWTSRESYFVQGGQAPQLSERALRNVSYY